MRTCVRAFDEQMCLKASKVSLKGIEDTMEEDYTSKQELREFRAELDWEQKNRDEATGVFMDNINLF